MEKEEPQSFLLLKERSDGAHWLWIVRGWKKGRRGKIFF